MVETYFSEDARKAVLNLMEEGIHTFFAGLCSSGKRNLSRIFGRRNLMQIDCLERLPEHLPMFSPRLTS